MTSSGTHSSTLVIMSIAIAMFASYTALDLAARIRASNGWIRQVWLGAAAVAMGGGIWAMHFVAMLAFSMPGMEVGYDLGLTLLSLLIAICVTGIAFAVMARSHGSGGQLLAAGLFMGLGVVGMHYMGMAAMQMSAAISYDGLWFSASVLIAIGAATSALWLASRNSGQAEKVVAALVMGGAISGMHFAGIKAATFTGLGVRMEGGPESVGQTALAVGVFAASFLVLLFSLVAAMFDRRFAVLAEREAVALRASEERFRSLYRGTPLPLHSLDQEGRIEQVSNTWLELMGYQRDEVVGRPLINFLTEESARQFRTTDWPALVAQDALEPREYRVVTKDGAFLDVVSAARIERDEHGTFLYLVGGLTDVTERKRAEEALRQAQKIETIGQLTGGVAHDFNNLLAVIMGNLDILRRKLPDDPKLMRLVESALEGAHRGASLTQRLLAFARRQDLRPEAVDVPELVRGMTDMLQRSLGPQVRVETRFPRDLPPVHADVNQLEMALLNLAVNARDAMPGGGKLDVSAAAESLGQPNIAGLPSGPYVRVTLADSGEGMDAATLARATEPFFTTKGIGKGTGLGLSMVHGLAAQSGGRLMIRSHVGHGTTIDLYLPATVKAAAAQRRAVDDVSVEPGEALDILVVDDDPLVLANTAAMLEDMGHSVRLARSGEDALDQLARDSNVDLVVTDQLMPGMTGSQLARRIRLGAADTPVLIVSGFAELEATHGGRFPLLPKPFDREALARALKDLHRPANVVPLRRKR
ncbi:MHYT domain-containing protein [Sphingomonas aerophila]|uniref:histidine kinase n=1 Tax=Sphingomonas aerophila TaxID=1344948 RepID=A0A7W9B9N4_9SPHN|nr:MHYT domain-containing protein [Sphingomonas aerophila]MBB5713192.1 PAS domain S-box-containing protein [Sphingomonas aerophila]